MSIVNRGPVRQYKAKSKTKKTIIDTPVHKSSYTPSVPVYTSIPHRSLAKKATPTIR